jgi:hypothetical protein
MTAKHELDRLSRESWKALAHDLKAASNSMGRVGLSCARRHPALLLGGGALLGFGAVMFLTRGKRAERSIRADARREAAERDAADRAVHRAPSTEEEGHKQARASKSPRLASAAVVRILKSAARMWLVEHLSREVRKDDPEAHTNDHEVPEADSSDLAVPAQSSA